MREAGHGRGAGNWNRSEAERNENPQFPWRSSEGWRDRGGPSETKWSDGTTGELPSVPAAGFTRQVSL